MTTTQEQVLSFDLGAERYCVGIDRVAEIVDAGDLTPVPDAPDHVVGVMDLRGRTTSIVDPRLVFDVDGEGDPDRIVVFDDRVGEEGTTTGWLVDDVSEVVAVAPEDVDRAPSADRDGPVRGVVRREDGFVVWVDPAAVHS